MRGTASAKRARNKLGSLMQRLAQVASMGASWPEAIRTYQPGLGAYFGMGLVGGGVTGAILLVGVQLLAPAHGRTPMPGVPAGIAALASLMSEPARPVLAKPAPAATAREPDADAFEMIIDASAPDRAPFGLRLVGAEADMEVVLRDLPATTLLSKGERREAMTWVLKAADLEGLHLAFHDGTPDAFDVRIEVLGPSGAAVASSIARVRVAGGPGASRTAAAPVETVIPRAVPASAASAAVDTPFETRISVSSRTPAGAARERAARATPSPLAAMAPQADRRPPEPPPPSETRHWPDGASALGAVPRATDRQLWWTLPAPVWSPFLDTGGR
jgi:hypothetical protein